MYYLLNLQRVQILAQVKVIAYADDIPFHVSGRNVHLMKSQLQPACQFFMEWCKQSKHSLTPSKSEMILFPNSRFPIENFHLKIDGYYVSLKNIIYLGLLLKGKLNWTTNIVSRRLKAKQFIFKIRRSLHSTWGVDDKILRLLY